MAIIKNKQLADDTWVIHQEDQPITDHSIVTLSYWLDNRATLIDTNITLGLLVEGDADLQHVTDDINRFTNIVIHIPVFTDGRGYSLARLIRQHYNYRGDLTAVGDILPDQALYLTRVGFNVLDFKSNASAQLALKKLDDFSVFYQAC